MRIWIKIHIAILLLLPPLLMGGVHTLTQAGLGVWACILALLWSFYLQRRPAHQRTILFDGWFLLFAIALGVTWLQFLPLPVTWWAVLSPGTDQIFRKILGPMGLYHSGHWQPLSLAPPETAAKIIRDMGSLVLYFVILQWVHQRSRLRWMMKAAVVSAGAIALLIVVQTALGINKPLMGLYQHRSTFINPIAASPFVNANHMGAYFFFHALLCLPLLVDTQRTKGRVFWSVLLILLSIFTFLSPSRGAVLGYALGLLGFGFVFWKQRLSKHQSAEEEPEGSDDETESQPHHGRRSKRHNRSVPYVVAALVLGLTLAVIINFAGLRKEFSDTQIGWNQDKMGFMTGHAKPLLQRYAWLGVGRGAMAMAWHRFADDTTLTRGQFMVTHVESNLIQPLIDWGIPFGSLFVLVAMFLTFLLIRRSKGLLEQSVLIALLALLLQNVADFNLEYIGTGFPFLAFLAGLQRLQYNRKRAPMRAWLWFPALLGVGALVSIAWLTPYAYKHHFYRLPQQWKQVAKAPAKTFQKKLKKLIVHHPSDYMLATMIAKHYTFAKRWEPAQALRWLQRASFLNPTASDIMIIRAYNLARLGLKEQAMQEVDRALKSRYILVRAAYPMLKQFKMLSLALKSSQNLVLVHYIHTQASRIHPQTEQYEKDLRQSIQRFPSDPLLQQLLARHLLSQWRSAYHRKSPDLPRYRKQLIEQIQKIPQTEINGKSYVSILLGEIASFSGDLNKAIQHYKEVSPRHKGHHWRALLGLFHIYLKQKKYSQARELLNTMRQRYRRNTYKAHLMYLDGELLRLQGHLRYALQRYEYATQYQPTRQYQLAQADLCWELGQYRCTIRIYRSLAKTDKSNYVQTKLRFYEKELKKRKQER